MGGSSIICPGTDPASMYRVESRSFVAWFKATLDTRDRLSSPASSLVHHPGSVYGRHASRSDPVSKRLFAGRCAQNRRVAGGKEGPAGSSTEIALYVTDSVNRTQIFHVLAAAARWPDLVANEYVILRARHSEQGGCTEPVWCRDQTDAER